MIELAIVYLVIFCSHFRNYINELQAAIMIVDPIDRFFEILECTCRILSYLAISIIYLAASLFS